MWNSKRILLLGLGFALFLAGYVVYAYFLGGIDGLPPLPITLRPSGNSGSLPPPPPDDVEIALWEKCLFVAPLGAIGAMTGQPAGVIRGVAETRRTLQAAMEEFAAVARGRGVGVPADAVGRSLKLVGGLPPEATASMQRDIAEGRPSELEYQVGTVVRYGRECGVPIPVTETIYGALLPYELQARGELETRLVAKP